MIKKLTLKNFQSHRDSLLQFSNGVNCIVGSSDVGKTALIRAIRWLVWNRPTGDAMRSRWGGDTSVSLELDNGEVRRFKNRKDNSYFLKENRNEQAYGGKLSALKTEVPAEVSLVLNIGEVNLQQQFDRPFLLDDSPGEVAAHFNRIAHIDSIDESNRAVQSWMREISSDIDADLRSSEELTEQLSEFSNLDSLDSELSDIEELERQTITLNSRILDLAETIGSLREVTELIRTENVTLSLSATLDRTLELIERRKEMESRKTVLATTLQRSKEIDDSMAEASKALPLERLVNELLILIKSLKGAEVRVEDLSRILVDIDATNRDIPEAQIRITTLENQFHREFPQTCPLCGHRQYDSAGVS